MLTIKWIWQNLKGNHGKYIVATVMQLIVAGMVVITPSITGKIIDQVVVGIKNASGVYETHPEKLVPLLIGMVGIHVTRMLGYYVLIILFEISAQGMKLSLRTKMYDNLQLLDMSYYSKSNTGDLMTRLTGDLDMMRHGATNVYRQLINSVVIYVAALAYLFTINWLFTLILMITSPMFFFARNRFSKKARPLFQATRERLSELNGYAQENIESNRVVKAFAKEEYECGRFKKYNEAFKQSNLKASFAWLNMHPIVESISQSLSIIIVLVGGLFVINGSLTFGELSVFLSLSWAISSPMSTIGVLLSDFERFITSTNKVMEVFYAKSNIVNPENAYKKEEKVQGKIDFNHVNFSYDGAPILTDIDFHIKPGQTLAVMGCTGSGKTTIASLIGRFYDVKSGEVLVDDINVKKYDIQYLRRNIGMATQDVFLFSETVDSNIAYGNEDLPEEEVIKCAKAADADSFISKMPAGYNTIIGERGVGLSGGQRQRIALARAIAVKPSILILDDTTSAVDVETEQYIWAELEKLNMNCTMVIIANRVSSVYKADCIIVLDNGRIAEMGSHQQLMSQKGYYYETFMLQNEGVIAESETGKAGE